MNRKRLKRMAAMMMVVVLMVCATTPAGSFAFASGADAQSNTEESRKQELYDSTLRKELEAGEYETYYKVVPISRKGRNGRLRNRWSDKKYGTWRFYALYLCGKWK